MILDVCCGSKMFYFDKNDKRVIFMDIMELETTLCDGRELKVKPDIIGDFRHIPFEDNKFHLVVFDPPHLIKAGDKSWLVKKYGKLSLQTWKEDLTQGFNECMRVLQVNGTLVFKGKRNRLSLLKF